MRERVWGSRSEGWMFWSMTVAVALAMSLISSTAAEAQNGGSVGSFSPLSTFEVPGEGVAEIVDATPDGGTLVYTDSDGGTVGIVDLSDPAEPSLVGEPVLVDGTPTSVSVSPDGTLALVAVQTSTLEEGEAPEITPGLLVAVDIANQEVVGSVEIGAGPDSLAVEEIGGELVAVVAIENEPVVVDNDGNQTDEEAPGSEGDVSDPGVVQVVTVDREDIAASEVADVDLNLSETDLLFQDDPQPEFVSLSPDGRAAVSLQENNGLAVFDVAAAAGEGAVASVYSLGVVEDRPADLTADGEVSFTETYPADVADEQPEAGTRVADAVAWSADASVVYTANEGEEDFTGGRGFSAFSSEGALLFDDGGSLEAEAAALDLYPEDVSEEKGTEIEGVETGVFGDTEFLFVGSEAGSFVAVYNLLGAAEPEFVQILTTGEAPEGLRAIPERNLLVTADEDSGTISIFEGVLVEDLTSTGGPPLATTAVLAAALFLVSAILATLVAASRRVS